MINTYRFLGCDHPDCYEEQGPAHDAAEAREMGKEHGWVRRMGKDYCPTHAAEMPSVGQVAVDSYYLDSDV